MGQKETRTCYDENNCDVEKGKPVEIQDCEQVIESESLTISYNQILKGLDFSMERDYKEKEETYNGRSSDGSSILTIIGDKDNIKEADLTLFMTGDDINTYKNSEILLTFLENVWNDSYD